MKFRIGSRVRLSRDSSYKHQSRNFAGTITEKTHPDSDFDWHVRWDYEKSSRYIYNNSDLIFDFTTNKQAIHLLKEEADFH